IFYRPVTSLLPALIAEKWAYRYAPDLAFLVIALGALGMGFAFERGGISRREYWFAGGLAIVLIVAGGLAGIVS
ncbi:MAG TPA: hypothetical protein VF395_01375, partial [Polyangiaceae bacterium]